MNIDQFYDIIRSKFGRLRTDREGFQRHLQSLLSIINRYQQDPFYINSLEPFVAYEKKSITGFQLSKADDAIPIIVGMNKNKNILVTAQMKRPYKTSTGIDRGSSTEKMMKFNQLSDESREKLNKTEFRDGIDLDNFRLTNAPNMSTEEALANGAIIPLNSREGVFLPKFVSMVHNMSLERETSVKLRTRATQRNSKNIEALSEANTRLYNAFLIPPEQLLNNNLVKKLTAEELKNGRLNPVSGNSLIRTYIDDTAYNNKEQGIYPVEFTFGTGNLANMIYFNYLFHKAAKESGIIPDDMVKQYERNGMHINIGMYHENYNHSKALRAVNAWFDVIGKSLLPMTVTPKRLRNSFWYNFERTDNYDRGHGRSFYRTTRLSSAQVLEFRYPQNIIDTGYVANQLILTNKAITDMALLSQDSNLQTIEVVGTGAPSVAEVTVLRNNDEYVNFVAENLLGIQDEVTKQWFKDFIKQCKNHR